MYPTTSTVAPTQNPTPAPTHSPDRCRKCRLHQPAHPSPWIHCSLCSSPWHWSCVTINQLDPIDIIEKWFCGNCTEKDPTLQPIYKEPPRKSSRAKSKKINYSDSSNDPMTDPDRFIKIANSKKNVIDGFDVPATGPHKPFRKMEPTELSLEWLAQDPNAMSEPIVIDDAEGLRALGMRMPDASLSISQIAQLVGPDTPVEVIDVASQAELSRWTLAQWALYYEDPKRERVRNVISLEVSDSPLGASVELPAIVKDFDWVHTIWPHHLRAKGAATYPKVQKYCLMSVARCWTDWHIDFAGSSVFYHILRGAKTFYFIRPTVANLAKYERWSGSSNLQESTWLGDQVNVVYKVSLTAGQTMMIPTGWIHAVHTPVDSLVFGGNFLHSLNIPLQLRIHQIENNTKVPKKFRFPFFLPMLWFVACHYLRKLENDENTTQQSSNGEASSSVISPNLDGFPTIPDRILAGLSALADFLLAQTESSDAHPPLTSTALSSILESHLDTEHVPNLGQTVTKFQTLLRLITPSKPVDEEKPSVPKSATPLKENQVENGDKKAFRSPLQITLKRKISAVVPAGEEGEGKKGAEQHKPMTVKLKSKLLAAPSHAESTPKGKGSEDPAKKANKTAKKAKPAPPARASSAAAAAAGHADGKKREAGEIVRISNPPPTNEIFREKRARPRVDNQPGPACETACAVQELDEVEVRTTRAENSVLRRSVDPATGFTIFETRTVRTIIEKAFFPPV
ncbi:hypothetical protein PCANC_13963 [Puccinia coronata f. sp. avenae]|uniref:JmjC domain-containing histone demethylation protein 1 n=1 Tax=Puccinia coronata f. sp. avenae TaxID=200324 RepID=A0A2N5SL56_9BASI|nr:hypothetical protein PCANC_13963 [Puccinia coronata f. sp. avenae]